MNAAEWLQIKKSWKSIMRKKLLDLGKRDIVRSVTLA